MENNESNKATKAGIGYTIGNYFLKGLSFFTLPIFSRLLSTEDYGIYNTFVAYESILFVIIGFALHTSYKKAKYRYNQDYQTYVSSSLVLIILNTILFLILSNIFGTYITALLDFDLTSINLLIIYSFSSAIITCYNSYVGLKYEYKNFLKVALINAISNLVLSIFLISTVFGNARYMGRVLGTVVPSFVISIFIIISILKKKKPEHVTKYWKWGLSYSLPIIPHGISQVILSQFDRIMIKSIIGSSQAGIYSFSYNIFSIINVTSNSLGTAWEPWFFEKMHKKEYKEIKNKSSLYAIGMLAFSILVMLVSPEIIHFLGTKDYWESVYTVVPIIAGGYFAFLYTIPSGIEYYHSKTIFIAIGTMSAAVINIVLNYFFILKYGYVAAAYTTLVTYLLYFLFHYILAWKIQGFCMFNTKVMVMCVIIAIAFVFICIALIDYTIIRWVIFFVIAIISLYIEENTLGFIEGRIKQWKN